MDIFEKIGNALYEGEEDDVVELIEKALEEGLEPQDILNNGLVAGMNVVGDDFKSGEVFLPDVISSAEAMKAGVRELKPALAAANQESVGTVVIGTVEGDVHDIGKNLVAVLLEGSGFTVYDIGVDLAPEAFVDAVDEYHPDIMGLSALLNTTMPAIQRTIEALIEAGKRDEVKVIIGGAPVNQDFADRVGADGYSGDAISASVLAKSLVK